MEISIRQDDLVFNKTRRHRQSSLLATPIRQSTSLVFLLQVHPVLTIYYNYQHNVTLFLNCDAQTNTNLLELELNDSETPVSFTAYRISVATC